jgi:hypothetical protein
LPVRELGKGAGQRCKHQKFGKGCAVYRTHEMPAACSLWNCRWLVNDDCNELSRPDRSHYVIDVMPDFVTVQYANGQEQNIQVAQIWIDPKYPDAHRDPALRRWIERRARDNIAALVRFNSRESLMIVAPSMADDGQWHERSGLGASGTHTPREIVQALTR